MGFSIMLQGAEKLVPVEYWCPYGIKILWAFQIDIRSIVILLRQAIYFSFELLHNSTDRSCLYCIFLAYY